MVTGRAVSNVDFFHWMMSAMTSPSLAYNSRFLRWRRLFDQLGCRRQGSHRELDASAEAEEGHSRGRSLHSFPDHAVPRVLGTDPRAWYGVPGAVYDPACIVWISWSFPSSGMKAFESIDGLMTSRPSRGRLSSRRCELRDRGKPRADG